MLERLKSFLGTLPERSRKGAPLADDPRVAAAALMIHVADADGLRADAEGKRLRTALSEAYALSDRQLEKILSAGEKASREAVDFFAFTSVLNRALDEAGKIEFVGLLWEMVYADGELHELEDNVVWRIAELIGVSARDRVRMRRSVREAFGIGDD